MQQFVEPLQRAVRRGDMQQQYGVSVSHCGVLMNQIILNKMFLPMFITSRMQLQQHFVEPLQEAARRGDMQQQYGVSVSHANGF
jgi:hypothetical protein